MKSVRLGKPEVGSIFLDAYQDGNNVVIEVRDDGAELTLTVYVRKQLKKVLLQKNRQKR